MAALPRTDCDREFDKFTENSAGETAVRVVAEWEDANGSSPTIYNVTTPGTANTETSQALSSNVRQFLLRVRGLANLQFAFVSGQSGSNYITVPRGASYTVSNLSLESATLYFQVDKESQVVEILEWT